MQSDREEEEVEGVCQLSTCGAAPRVSRLRLMPPQQTGRFTPAALCLLSTSCDWPTSSAAAVLAAAPVARATRGRFSHPVRKNGETNQPDQNAANWGGIWPNKTHPEVNKI